jgi:hypothetical protein
METKSLKNPAFVENYFNNMNEISKKISLDVKNVKASYEHIWNELSHDEQSNILDETIIRPEITLLYFDFSSSDDSLKNITDEKSDDTKTVNLFDGKNLSTYASIKTGLKVNHDENGLFRDPHSAPFNAKTKSQINLNIFDVEKKKPSGGRNPKSIIMSAKNGVKSTKNNEKVKEVNENKAASNIASIINNNLMYNGNDSGFSTPDINDKTQLFPSVKDDKDTSLNSSVSVEEDDKGEFHCLLSTAKVDFDFLNNW